MRTLGLLMIALLGTACGSTEEFSVEGAGEAQDGIVNGVHALRWQERQNATVWVTEGFFDDYVCGASFLGKSKDRFWALTAERRS
ncbi:MAG: hypothetical protein AAFY60_06015, partial [Myxococcota bacterium]